jgi:hypothetical protein
MTPHETLKKSLEEEFDNKFVGGMFRTQKQQDMLDFIKSHLTTTSLSLIDSVMADIERRKKYTNWSHTRGSHSDDPQDTEPCDCGDEEIKIKNRVFDDLTSFLQQEKDKINNLMK